MTENLKPCLKDKQIINVLQELGIVEKKRLKDTDLQCPTVQLVIELYTGIIGMLELDCNTEAREFQTLDYPENHNAIMQYGVLAKNLKHIFQCINCTPEFRLSDLIRPDTKRTRFFLAELCNFLLFTTANVNKVKNAQDSRRNYAAKLQGLQQKRDELKNQVTKQLEERGVWEDKVKDFDKRMAAAGSAKKNLVSEIETLEASLGESATEEEELKERNSARLRAKEDKVAKMKQLESLIVNSPDRVRGELVQLQEAARRLDEQVGARENVLQERKKLQELMEVLLANACDIKERAMHTSKLVTEKRMLGEQIETRQTESNKVSSTLKLQTDELCRISSQSSSVGEKLAAVQLTQQTKLHGMSHNFNSYLKLREELEDKLDLTDQRVAELSAEERELQEERAEYVKYEAEATETQRKVLQMQIEDYTDKDILPAIRETTEELKCDRK